MNNQVDVSIIIVNYKTPNLVRDCISSIISNTSEVLYEIIVIDNDSKDNSKEILETKFPNIKYIQSDSNLGFGKANNLGVTYASGKYVFLLNSDTIILNNAIKIFFDYAENNQGVGAFGTILYNNQLKPCHSYGPFITPRSELKNILAKYFRFLKDKSLLAPKEIKTPFNVDYITGADLFISKKIYNDIGGFDPEFFMYCEEVDLQKRMEDNSLVRLIIPGPKIIHLEGGSDKGNTTIWSVNRLINIYKSKRIYFKKNFKMLTKIWFYPLYIILYIPIIVLISIIKKDLGYVKIIKYL